MSEEPQQSGNTEKAQWYWRDAEDGVLSCMLQAPDRFIPAAIEALPMGVEAFAADRGVIFEALCHLAADGGGALSIAELTTYLRETEALGKVGGPVRLVEILRHAPSLAQFDHYAGQVVRHWQRREIARIGQQMMASAAKIGEGPEGIVDTAQAALERVRRVDTRKGLVPIQPLLHDAIEQAQEIYARRGQLLGGLATGLADVDRCLLGLKGGDLVVIAARPSMGKTAMVMTWLENMALGVEYRDFKQEPIPVAAFSLEMSALQLAQRMVWGRARINLIRMRDGMLRQSDLQRLEGSVRALHAGQIYIDDQAGLSLSELGARLTLAVKRWGIRAAFVDYLQLMRGSAERARQSRQIEVGEISAGLKKLAKELDIPIICAAQLNRNPEQRKGSSPGRPALGDLRESGNIEQDADVVGLLYRADYYNKGAAADDDDDLDDGPPRTVQAVADGLTRVDAILDIAKQRNGPVGEQRVVFVKELARFENPPGKDKIYDTH